VKQKKSIVAGANDPSEGDKPGSQLVDPQQKGEQAASTTFKVINNSIQARNKSRFFNPANQSESQNNFLRQKSKSTALK